MMHDSRVLYEGLVNLVSDPFITYFTLRKTGRSQILRSLFLSVISTPTVLFCTESQQDPLLCNHEQHHIIIM